MIQFERTDNNRRNKQDNTRPAIPVNKKSDDITTTLTGPLKRTVGEESQELKQQTPELKKK